MVLNYQQFYLDLAKSQKSGKANWNLEYDAVKDYSLRNLDVKNVASLADSFMDDTEDTIFKKYLRYNSVSAAVSPPCNDTCRSVHYCSITQLEKDKYYQCLTGFQTTASPNSTPHHHHHPPPKKVQPYYIYIIAGLGALVFILFIIVAILCIKKRRHFIPHRYSRFGSVIKGPINWVPHFLELYCVRNVDDKMVLLCSSVSNIRAVLNAFVFIPPNRIIGGTRSEWLGAYCFCPICMFVCLSFVNFNLRYNF